MERCERERKEQRIGKKIGMREQQRKGGRTKEDRREVKEGKRKQKRRRGREEGEERWREYACRCKKTTGLESY